MAGNVKEDIEVGADEANPEGIDNPDQNFIITIDGKKIWKKGMKPTSNKDIARKEAEKAKAKEEKEKKAEENKENKGNSRYARRIQQMEHERR